ncbi:peptide-methionine (S)-S-oxide reductase MsrA [Metamycoplasma alkalescens]|uniref:peptide-methionine (S)-S-oxide reductase MsrA n=1 Tax=Metamycoplasma alkalescens TaxID=45363 RepID=UPI00039D1396|nr:peptide-methionine (S)-S-oxide reductase MsrA [Metamycoplasma alkalescens]
MEKVIYVAGGCFWGVEAFFAKIKGVVDTEVGYANGITKETSYQNLKNTQHAETIKITYDPNLVSLEELILYLFKIINPSSLNKQGNDVGIQYRTGVYYQDNADLMKLEALFAYLKKDYDPFYVELKPLDHFVVAEEYHQDYLQKKSLWILSC